MGHLTTDYIRTKCALPKAFIETGTFKGGQIQEFLETGTHTNYSEIHTIEISEELCQIASARMALYEHHNLDISKFDRNTDEQDVSFKNSKTFFDNLITIHHGDSKVLLKRVLSQINEPAVIWLDAHPGKRHYSGKDVPLLEELNIIQQNSSKHIIFIDDVDKFGVKQEYCDWTDIQYQMIIDKLLQINPNYHITVEAPYGCPLLCATPETGESFMPESSFIFR